MKIKVVSDLHLEFSDVTIPNDENCDVLVLSGDIMVAEELHDIPPPDPYTAGAIDDFMSKIKRVARYRDFLKRCSDTFPYVIYVAGNHEFYHGRWVASLTHLREECSRYPNVYFLERDMKEIDGVVFVGGTLWTDMNKFDPITLHAIRDMMNDYKLIRRDDAGFSKLGPAHTVERHRQTLGYIKSILADRKDKKCVVVGHHSPSSQSTHEQYKGEFIMNGAYHSSLEDFIIDHPQIKLWTHGHTHHCFDYVIGETRVVCNPRGYHTERWHEDSGWDLTKVIEI